MVGIINSFLGEVDNSVSLPFSVTGEVSCGTLLEELAELTARMGGVVGLNGPERDTTAGTVPVANIGGCPEEIFGGGGGIEEGGKSRDVNGLREAVGGRGIVVGGEPVTTTARGIGGEADGVTLFNFCRSEILLRTSGADCDILFLSGACGEYMRGGAAGTACELVDATAPNFALLGLLNRRAVSGCDIDFFRVGPVACALGEYFVGSSALLQKYSNTHPDATWLTS